MKKVLYLLLFATACKSSSSSSVPGQPVNRIALIREKMLNEYISTTFRPEMFEGDIAHISEVCYATEETDDGHVLRDTILSEYLFRDKRLYQIAKATRRMPNDTLTIQYDTTGKILALVYSDGRSNYNTDRFKYDAAGRLIEKTNRIYSTESRNLYKYNQAGDSVLVKVGTDGHEEGLYFSDNDGVITVTQALLADSLGRGKVVTEYNEQNQAVTLYSSFLDKVQFKEILKYDSHGNVVALEHHNVDPARNDFSPVIDPPMSYTTQYTYDNKGNWTSKNDLARAKKTIITTTRKITYR